MINGFLIVVFRSVLQEIKFSIQRNLKADIKLKPKNRDYANATNQPFYATSIDNFVKALKTRWHVELKIFANFCRNYTEISRLGD